MGLLILGLRLRLGNLLVALTGAQLERDWAQLIISITWQAGRGILSRSISALLSLELLLPSCQHTRTQSSVMYL